MTEVRTSRGRPSWTSRTRTRGSRLVRLSRNFGQHAAITAGLEHARGDWIVVMDCDLQDPPEQVPILYEQALDGFDVVLARRIGSGNSFARRLASAAYFRVLNALLGTSFDAGFGNFSVISRKVRTRVSPRARQGPTLPHDSALARASARPRSSCREPIGTRETARTRFAMLFRFAVDGLFFQTTTLLRWIVYAGFAISALGTLLAAFFIVNYFAGNPYPGWTSLGVLLLLLSGFIIVSTGVAGCCSGKIFVQAKDRPLYVVDQVVEAEADSGYSGAPAPKAVVSDG